MLRISALFSAGRNKTHSQTKLYPPAPATQPNRTFWPGNSRHAQPISASSAGPKRDSEGKATPALRQPAQGWRRAHLPLDPPSTRAPTPVYGRELQRSAIPRELLRVTGVSFGDCQAAVAALNTGKPINAQQSTSLCAGHDNLSPLSTYNNALLLQIEDSMPLQENVHMLCCEARHRMGRTSLHSCHRLT